MGRDGVPNAIGAVYRIPNSDVLLLEIVQSRLAATAKVESPDGGRDSCPHVYGRLNRDVVVKVTHVDVREDGRLHIASAL